VSVPAGLSRDGLPLSVQLVGPEGSEARLLRLAAQLERERDWLSSRPPGTEPSALADHPADDTVKPS